MASEAYKDYALRMKEPVFLIRLSFRTPNPADSSALSKAAAVLAAAALERYLNDVLHEYCREIAATRWDDLSEGQKAYLLRGMSKFVALAARKVWKTAALDDRSNTRLLRAIREVHE